MVHQVLLDSVDVSDFVGEISGSPVSVDDELDDAPNFADVTFLPGFTPDVGQEIQVKRVETGVYEFGGHVISRRQISQGEQAYFRVRARDYTWQAGFLKVNGSFTGTASAIGAALVATFAPGFSAAGIDAGLPLVEGGIEFTEEDFNTALARLATRVGAYSRIDYTRTVYLFTEDPLEPPDPLDATNKDFRGLEWEEDLSQVRNRVLCVGGGTRIPVEIAPGSTKVPVDDVSWFSVSGGKARAGQQRITYGGTVVGGGGALIGTAITPTNPPTVVPDWGAGMSAGVRQYAVTFVTASGETVPSPIAAVSVPGTYSPPTGGHDGGVFENGTAGSMNSAAGTYDWTYTFRDPATGRETTRGPDFGSSKSSGITSMKLDKSMLTPAPAGMIRRWYRTVLNGATFRPLKAIFDTGTGDTAFFQSSPDGLYWSDFRSDADLDTTAQPPATNTLIKGVVQLSNIPIGPSGVTARKIYRTTAGGAQLKLVTTLANNSGTTYTDSLVDGSLGANAPTADTSGLVAAGDMPAGSTTITVTSTAPFQATGGWAYSSGVYIRYAGVGSLSLTGVPASGVGSLAITLRNGSEIIALSMMTGIPAAGAGSIVHTILKDADVNLLAQADDAAAQAVLAALLGVSVENAVIEHVLSDGRLTIESAQARANADLALFKNPIVTVSYETTDVKTKAGKTISINLGAPWNLTGDFKIQRVSESELAPGDVMLRAVEASSVRFSFEDMVRRIQLTA